MVAWKYWIAGFVGIATIFYLAKLKENAMKRAKEKHILEAKLKKERRKKLKRTAFKNQPKLITGFCREFIKTNGFIPTKIIETMSLYYKMIIEIPWIEEEHKNEKHCCGFADVSKRKATLFGFVYFIGLNENDKWINPYLTKQINLTINPNKMGSWFNTECLIHNFLNIYYAHEVFCRTIDSKEKEKNPPYIIIDFKDRFIKPTYYMLKQDRSGNGNMLAWDLRARKGNNSKWVILSEHRYSTEYKNQPPRLNECTSWKLDNVNEFYNQYQIIMTTRGNIGCEAPVFGWWLTFCGFELYGEMY